ATSAGSAVLRRLGSTSFERMRSTTGSVRTARSLGELVTDVAEGAFRRCCVAGLPKQMPGKRIAGPRKDTLGTSLVPTVWVTIAHKPSFCLIFDRLLSPPLGRYQ